MGRREFRELIVVLMLGAVVLGICAFKVHHNLDRDARADAHLSQTVSRL